MHDAILNVTGEAASATVAIAKNGDVVFTVGPERRRLQIYSLFLKTVSPVFDAMLGPHFKEGQQLTQRGEVELPLEGDNAAALEIIFNIIHGQNHAVPDELSPEDLLQVAIVGDKYNCFTTLKFAIQIWLESAYQNANPLHPDMVTYVATGRMAADSPARMPAFASLSATSAAGYLDLGTCPRHVYMSRDFAQTVEGGGSNYTQRLVQWVLVSSPRSYAPTIDTVMVISPYEAQMLLPAIQKSTSVALCLYAPRPNQGYRALDALDLYTVPE